ncbi:Spo0E like sporulation regulatory protein [Schinkia azotoformans MEV2011]|uniref:Spo0E like sporulation regulatory protein n=1 Tax=Schinkia azotoformans MEV2011 TaxID=1348973 RepID=A0A072NLE6_SCHAZ|nr:aspartyl-phosphate phosphatase Spo0E family protein [Schinkia azotoformans]KEF38281.1 Spo0E like sporulation regulatory protein [Schinkia azotoformans MEV2011]MEC1694024.1 aspartyl-phosphate phosphatase Spo0E family protein [Schinkia azotoformans]MEC1715736.1 aspartyl-phosphate phosphatase Spo0E family protein [Schinkia azotoformans]MEC1724971.1 aspartyl-phosphate phosphatase Spo0E family protein [Schinkia azotoformans]MEC1741375.1 aspartyl-phosphate phosphatase Spo0E family protein [Schink
METTSTKVQLDQLNSLHSLIEKKRKQMINNGLQYGFTNKRTIMISQELDKLINEVLLLGNLLTKECKE